MTSHRGQSLKVEGLRDLQRTLREMDRDLLPVLRRTNKEIADEVAVDARSRAHGIHKGGERLARAITSVSQQRSAGVQISDGGRTAGALGYEFGAGHDTSRNRRSGQYVGFRQFDVWRGNGPDAGYAVYPAIRAAAPDLPEKYLRALDPLLRKAFPD